MHNRGGIDNERGYHKLNVQAGNPWGNSFNPIEDIINLLDSAGYRYARLFNLFRAAGSGDQEARAYLGYLWHQAGLDVLQTLSNVSAKASIVFLVIGMPQIASGVATVGLVADSLLVLDDLLNSNYSNALLDGAVIIAGVVLKTNVEMGVRRISEKGLKISIGKNGRYYSMGRRGAMQSKRAIRSLIAADIANSVFGNLAPEFANRILRLSMDAYDATKNEDE